MFMRVLAVGVVLSSVVVAPVALADHGKYRQVRSDGRATYEYARVVNVEPIVRRVRVETPQRECWQEDRYEEPASAQRGVAGPMILGGLIGGAVGKHVSRDHRRTGMLAGAIIGSAIGHDIGERRRAAQSYHEPRVYTVERCGVRYVDNYEERIEGYDVEYVYEGRHYHTRLPYDPGERIRIRVDVTPAERRYHDDERFDD